MREVFDRINVVVRRRRDQPHARRAMADAGDFLVDFVTGKLASFARLGALGHFDLQFLRANQVFAGDAEAAARDLLDGAGAAVAVRVADVARRVFAPFARIAFAADAIHGDRQRFVRFLGDRAVRHGAGGEPLDDVDGRFDFFQRNRLFGRFEIQQAPQREQPPFLARRSGRQKFLNSARLLICVACCSLATTSGLNMWASPLRRHWYWPPTSRSSVCGTCRCGYACSCRRSDSSAMPSRPMPSMRLAVQVKYSSTNGVVQADGFENLSAAVALLRRDAHLRNDLQQPLRRPP